MKTYEYLYSYPENGPAQLKVQLFEQSAWRVLVTPLLHWIDLRKPRWMDPGHGRRDIKHHGDGTCTFLWRLRLECWLGFDFEHRGRRVRHTFEVAADDPGIPAKVAKYL